MFFSIMHATGISRCLKYGRQLFSYRGMLHLTVKGEAKQSCAGPHSRLPAAPRYFAPCQGHITCQKRTYGAELRRKGYDKNNPSTSELYFHHFIQFWRIQKNTGAGTRSRYECRCCQLNMKVGVLKRGTKARGH